MSGHGIAAEPYWQTPQHEAAKSQLYIMANILTDVAEGRPATEIALRMEMLDYGLDVELKGLLSSVRMFDRILLQAGKLAEGLERLAAEVKEVNGD